MDLMQQLACYFCTPPTNNDSKPCAEYGGQNYSKLIRMKTYTHPQEAWDEAECNRRSNYAPKDHWGNRPPKGIIAGSASTYPGYGQTIRFNGGTVIDDEWYEAVCKPLPIIPDSYEIVNLPSWGTIIRKKQ